MPQKRISGQDFIVGMTADGVSGVPFSASNPMPVQISGGANPGIEDLLFTDDTGAQFIYRDSGTTPPVFTAYLIPAGTVYTVGANPRPYAVRDVIVSNLPATLGQKAAAGSVSVVLSSDGPFATNFGITTDAASAWYTVAGGLLAKIGLLIAATVEAGSHAYGYTAGNLTTDAWTLFGVTRTKTYTWVSGVLTSESDWV